MVGPTAASCTDGDHPLMWWLGQLSMPVLMRIVIAYGTASVVNVAAMTVLAARHTRK